MPRYHINVFDGIAAIDEDGIPLGGVVEARLEAMRIASDLIRGEAQRGNPGDERRVEVTDGRGMILFRIDVVMSASAAVAQEASPVGLRPEVARGSQSRAAHGPLTTA